MSKAQQQHQQQQPNPEKPRRRAHRWDPVAFMAVSQKSAEQQQADNDNDDDDSSSVSPVVVFCPFAAKGAQMAGGGGGGDAAASDTADNNNNKKKEDADNAAASSTTTTTTKDNDARRAARNKDDIVTATAFWLVDSTLNRVIARLEKDGLISALTELVQSNATCTDSHLASHQRYRERVLAMLPRQGQRDFFTSEFIENQNVNKRKFGNQAVSHEKDLKCAHALVAQALVPGLGPCPLGDVVVGFIECLGKRVEEEDKEEEEDSEQKSARLPENWHTQLLPLFKDFAKSFQFSAAAGATGGVASAAEVTNTTTPTDATELIRRAQIIVDAFATEAGEGSGRRRKRRTD